MSGSKSIYKFTIITLTFFFLQNPTTQTLTELKTGELSLWGTIEGTRLSRRQQKSVHWDVGLSEEAVQGPKFGFRVRKSWV
jgi:hypothetical protein